MINLSDVTNQLPPIQYGEQLINNLGVYPTYNHNYTSLDIGERLLKLSDIYRLYIPSQMGVEIYSKLYIALVHSLEKKSSLDAMRQHYLNHEAVKRQEHGGILGGADSFTIIGASGIGKTTAINRAVDIMTGNKIIEVSEPYVRIIPCLTVQCPYDSSVKGLLLEILRKADEVLDSRYYGNGTGSRMTTDVLIGLVSQVALNHIGLLVIDEIQNVVNSKHGKSIIGALTQLINNSGISICMVGVPECLPFFGQAMQLARRSLGLSYGVMECNDQFEKFCETVYSYQYTRECADYTGATTEWLYEHSGGNASVVVSLIHDAQEISILDGTERLDIAALEKAYKKRLTLLHAYIQPTMNRQTTQGRVKAATSSSITDEGNETESQSIEALARIAKSEGVDVVGLIKRYYPVYEVKA